MASHTIKVTGVSPELLQLLDARIRAVHSAGRAEYVRELIRKDVLEAAAQGSGPARQTFREILSPIHAETRRSGFTEEEIERDVDEAISEYRSELAAGRKVGST